MFRIFGIIVLGVLLSCGSKMYAQSSKTYIGKVMNIVSNNPIEGATVKIQSNGQVLTTKEDGTFVITSATPPQVEITHINYFDTIVTFDGQYRHIFIREKSKAIEEVVIVRRKNINDIDIRNLVGSVVVVDIAKLSERSEMDMGRLLEGQVPGLTVTYSGELGAKPEIRIRGNSSFSYKDEANEPLFVMDGVIISTETFLTLNPSDFQTIKVLKDAPATALYGIKAANGVIELTSKKGFVGKPSVSFSMKQGVTLRGERTVQMMRTDEKLRFEERMENLSLPGYLYSENYIRKTYSNSPDLDQRLAHGSRFLDSLRQYDTDWFKELIRINHFQTYNIGIRGGTERNTYFYSANYSKQGGRVPGNDINQITARANLDYALTDKIHVSINNSVGLATTNTENGMTNDPTALAFDLNPYETPASSNLVSYPGRSFSDLVNQYRKRNNAKRLSSTAIAHWDVLTGLNISGVVGVDYSLEENYERIYTTAYSQRNTPANAKGYISEGDNKNFGFTSNFRANYQRQFGIHDIYAGINTDYYESRINMIGGSGHGIADDIESLSGVNQALSKAYNHTVVGSKTTNKQLGFGAALGYTLLNTYDFYASFKRDGSSMLPSSKRWNDAWSAGLGWSPSTYSFFKNQQILTDLKIKGSLGYTASMVGIVTQDVTTTFGSSNGFYADQRLLQLLALPNKDLNPQQTYTTNVGIDFGFVHRINFLINIYNNLTKQAILAVPIASSNGFKTYSQNIGELQNNGIEFALNGDVIRSDNFRWNSSVSLSYNANKVRSLYGTDRLFLNENSIIPDYEVGKPLGILYGLQSNGIHPLTGIPEYITADGTVIDLKQPLQESYFRNLGYSIAPYSGFFNHLWSYKNWSLSMNINYAFGGTARYSSNFVREGEDAHLNALQGQLDNMWFEVGDENKIYPIKTLPNQLYEVYKGHASTTTIYKTDFIKINHAQLSYNWVPAPNIRKYLKSTRWILQADNIYTYRFEKDSGGLNNVTQPVITFSLNASF